MSKKIDINQRKTRSANNLGEGKMRTPARLKNKTANSYVLV